MAQAQGMKTLRQAGLLKVLAGATTVDEVLRVTVAE
jgi:type II secretory ATPase GspE/PulE/Tfp pilus assembly ATPase PilB-like protein